MGLLDRILGREPEPEPAPTGRSSTGPARTADQRAIERYRYLLATAPPDAVEQAHAEAFAQLTPDQRRQVLQQLAEHVPPAERLGDDPASLARMATRTELRRPGTLERTLGGGPGARGYGGPGLGTIVGGSLLGTVAGVVVGSAVASMRVGPAFGDLGPVAFTAAAAATGADDAAGAGDAAAETGPDPVAADQGGMEGAEAGGDVGGFGADVGGMDLGGDFGGADFGGF